MQGLYNVRVYFIVKNRVPYIFTLEFNDRTRVRHGKQWDTTVFPWTYKQLRYIHTVDISKIQLKNSEKGGLVSKLFIAQTGIETKHTYYASVR